MLGSSRVCYLYVPNSVKICQYMPGAKDVQGARVCKYVSRSFKETKGRTNKRVKYKSRLYHFQKGHASHTNNRSQYMPSGIVWQVLMYVNTFNQGVLGHARDYMHANTC